MRARALAAVLLAAAFVGGCGVPVDEEPRNLRSPGISYGSSGPAPDRFGSAVERLYLVRDGGLARVLRRVPAARSPEQTLQDLLAGPTAAEHEDGLSTALSTMTIDGIAVDQRRAVVAIGGAGQQGTRSDEILAYGQIVCTLTSQGAEVGTVSFTSDGRPLGVPRGDGSLSADPLTIADYAGLLGS
ncbi:GerMN domain-containing protein [Paractinoplanes rhizophilus]|uniref:GerMN domain-containing protein n=1 Tax=Paractinoplanes rhizophilus TaxID=1416877 RepID=A0ABW2HS42_9ACTN